VNQNPLAKFMQKLENEMLITVVDWQLNDSSYATSPFSTKADSSCYQSTVKSGDSTCFFISYFIMANTWKMLLMHLIAFGSCHFLWQNQWLSDEYWWTTSTKSGLFHCTYNELNGDLRKSELHKMSV